MKEAEQALEQELQLKSPAELDIESVDDSAPYIEMVSLKSNFKIGWVGKRFHWQTITLNDWSRGKQLILFSKNLMSGFCTIK